MFTNSLITYLDHYEVIPFIALSMAKTSQNLESKVVLIEVKGSATSLCQILNDIAEGRHPYFNFKLTNPGK